MSLEKARSQLELKRVELGAMELEYKILQRQEEIDRLKESLEVSYKKIEELKEELSK